jgi:mannose-6-phosphate isomerase-like protein (cupin superfamily)
MTTRTALSPAPAVQAGPTWTAARLGPLAQVDRYALTLPQLPKPVRGKVFLKPLLGLTGMEVSVTKLPALPGGAAIPFLHRHRAHEELYVFTGGRGQLLVDGEAIDVEEGVVVRIASGGARTLRAAPGEELRYLCIQAPQDALGEAEAAEDGERLAEKPAWPAPPA